MAEDTSVTKSFPLAAAFHARYQPGVFVPIVLLCRPPGRLSNGSLDLDDRTGFHF